MNPSSIKIFQYARRIPEIYGTFIALGLIIYFFIAYSAGFLHVIEYRLLNLVIMSIGILFIESLKERTEETSIILKP